MNVKDIKDIVNLMNDSDLAEIEIERDGEKLKIKKTSAAAPAAVSVQPQVVPLVQPSTGAAAAPAATAAAPANQKTINSPMVGTFYRAPSPDAAPYVEAGQTVEKGQVVCIVEAMKLMNEIKSDTRGKIVAIPVENAQAVEFGQALFVLEPA
ncbi:MAG: acetyl-CoA carboxylase biotin carboxyl carrier protein [Candidatus Omnitrophica bacterium]|nr:acetyl-CoA carboxylase biotin carboxyl carrier protein [Candidatus Omnitrophota bacterium]